MKWRIQLVREDAGDITVLVAPRPPETVWKGRVICGHCSTTFEPYQKWDTHPQCPECGKLTDLTEYINKSEHPGLEPVA
jgi:hypothetical protein